jgi:hypothetical protein
MTLRTANGVASGWGLQGISSVRSSAEAGKRLLHTQWAFSPVSCGTWKGVQYAD